MKLDLEINPAQSILTGLIPINKHLLFSDDALYDGVCGWVSDQAKMNRGLEAREVCLHAEKESQTHEWPWGGL